MSSPTLNDLPPHHGQSTFKIDRPIRCIWRPSLPGAGPLPQRDAVQVLSFIQQASPLLLEIWLTKTPSFPLDISWAKVKVIAPPEILAGLPPGMETAVDFTPYQGQVPRLKETLPSGEAVFLLGEGTVPVLRETLETAARQGIGKFSLPSFPFELIPLLGPPFSSPQTFSSTWEKEIAPLLPLLSSFQWSIHDRFVAEKFREAGLSPLETGADAGCQGGSLLAYISPEREVYPCPSWPVPFGRLATSWDAIWGGESRATFLETFSPHFLCRTCRRWETCRGGCPGLATALNLQDRPDPLCPEEAP